MSGPDDRALTLLLKSVTDSLPMGARVLDVEPTAYTRGWFDRFNQFDYRTMGHGLPDIDIDGTLTTVTLTRGICNLLVMGQGVGASQDLAALAGSLRSLMADGSLVVIRESDDADAAQTSPIRSALSGGGFSVRENDLSRQLGSDVVQRYGLARSGTFLLATPDRTPAARPTGHAHHGHA